MLFQANGGTTFAERVAAVSERFADVRPVREVIDFISVESSRGLTQPKSNGG
jgi:hypothetical protein